MAINRSFSVKSATPWSQTTKSSSRSSRTDHPRQVMQTSLCQAYGPPAERRANSAPSGGCQCVHLRSTAHAQVGSETHPGNVPRARRNTSLHRKCKCTTLPQTKERMPLRQRLLLTPPSRSSRPRHHLSRPVSRPSMAIMAESKTARSNVFQPSTWRPAVRTDTFLFVPNRQE